MQPYMWPVGQPSGWGQAQRLNLRTDLRRQCIEGTADLADLDPRQDAHGAEVMAMQRLRETAQDRLVGVGRDAVDDQLVARDAECEGRAILEQPFCALGHTGGCGFKGGMPDRVYGVLMKRDRELDEKRAQLPRKNNPVPSGNRFGHVLSSIGRRSNIGRPVRRLAHEIDQLTAYDGRSH